MILFNLSLSTGTLSNMVQKMYGNSNLYTILSLNLFKIYEKCIKARNINFLSYFSKNQFGLLKCKSTTDAHYLVNKYKHKN